MTRGLIALGLAAALCGCQSTQNYSRIGYGPELAVADAHCNLMALSAQQGYIAWGSDAYLAGAAVGNAIGNAITASIVKKNCMTINGWGQMSQRQKKLLDGGKRQRAEVARMKAAGQKFPPAPKCSTCRG